MKRTVFYDGEGPTGLCIHVAGITLRPSHHTTRALIGDKVTISTDDPTHPRFGKITFPGTAATERWRPEPPIEDAGSGGVR